MLTPEQLESVTRRLREEAERAAALPQCVHCGQRCDPPFGNGTRCLPCSARPTGECMRTVINV
jgi:hypothetical protein